MNIARKIVEALFGPSTLPEVRTAMEATVGEVIRANLLPRPAPEGHRVVWKDCERPVLVGGVVYHGVQIPVLQRLTLSPWWSDDDQQWYEDELWQDVGLYEGVPLREAAGEG